jgi:hypothetical protein
MELKTILDIVGALGGLLAGVATTFLVIIGRQQIVALRAQMSSAQEDSRVERTLAACSRYESDQVIERCVKTLKDALRNGEYDRTPRDYEHEAKMVLNYLDTIAIGIKQGLYIEELARDHMKPILRYYREHYMDPSRAFERGINLDEYACLNDLASSWLGRSEVQFRVGTQASRREAPPSRKNFPQS